MCENQSSRRIIKVSTERHFEPFSYQQEWSIKPKKRIKAFTWRVYVCFNNDRSMLRSTQRRRKLLDLFASPKASTVNALMKRNYVDYNVITLVEPTMSTKRKHGDINKKRGCRGK